MESLLAQQESLSSPAAMTERVLRDARRAFGDAVDGAVLDHCSREAVAGLWGETIRIRTFVPVLALRQIREMLEAPEQPPAASDTGRGG